MMLLLFLFVEKAERLVKVMCLESGWAGIHARAADRTVHDIVTEEAG